MTYSRIEQEGNKTVQVVYSDTGQRLGGQILYEEQPYVAPQAILITPASGGSTSAFIQSGGGTYQPAQEYLQEQVQKGVEQGTLQADVPYTMEISTPPSTAVLHPETGLPMQSAEFKSGVITTSYDVQPQTFPKVTQKVYQPIEEYQVNPFTGQPEINPFTQQQLIKQQESLLGAYTPKPTKDFAYAPYVTRTAAASEIIKPGLPNIMAQEAFKLSMHFVEPQLEMAQFPVQKPYVSPYGSEFTRKFLGQTIETPEFEARTIQAREALLTLPSLPLQYTLGFASDVGKFGGEAIRFGAGKILGTDKAWGESAWKTFTETPGKMAESIQKHPASFAVSMAPAAIALGYGAIKLGKAIRAKPVTKIADVSQLGKAETIRINDKLFGEATTMAETKYLGKKYPSIIKTKYTQEPVGISGDMPINKAFRMAELQLTKGKGISAAVTKVGKEIKPSVILSKEESWKFGEGYKTLVTQKSLEPSGLGKLIGKPYKATDYIGKFLTTKTPAAAVAKYGLAGDWYASIGEMFKKSKLAANVRSIMRVSEKADIDSGTRGYGLGLKTVEPITKLPSPIMTSQIGKTVKAAVMSSKIKSIIPTGLIFATKTATQKPLRMSQLSRQMQKSTQSYTQSSQLSKRIQKQFQMPTTKMDLKPLQATIQMLKPTQARTQIQSGGLTSLQPQKQFSLQTSGQLQRQLQKQTQLYKTSQRTGTTFMLPPVTITTPKIPPSIMGGDFDSMSGVKYPKWFGTKYGLRSWGITASPKEIATAFGFKKRRRRR